MKKIFFAVFFLLTAFQNVFAQNLSGKYLFSYLTVDNGLTNNFVDNIYKDSRGFMWISTLGGGLLRYDGYVFLHFNNRSKCPLKSNFVRQTVEDNFSRLWIASEGGLDVMELTSFARSGVLNEESEFPEVFSSTIQKLIKASDGSIWAALKKSVVRFTFDDAGNIAKINVLRPDIDITTPVVSLFEYDGQMLAGINNGVSKIITADNGELIAVRFQTF